MASNARGLRCITVLNFVKIGQMVAEISRFFDFFKDGGHPASWISLPCAWTTHETYLAIFTGV